MLVASVVLWVIGSVLGVCTAIGAAEASKQHRVKDVRFAVFLMAIWATVQWAGIFCMIVR